MLLKRSTRYCRYTRPALLGDVHNTNLTGSARVQAAQQLAAMAGLAARQDECSTSGRQDAQGHGRQLLSVAPMMEWTDVHFRQLARLISKHTWLWTEMVVDKTILHNPSTDKFLWFPPEQRPLVLQLGGSNPDTLAAATTIATRYGYDEINLNCGCPSDRVAGAGCFGASLMLNPEVVADCMAAVAAAAGPSTSVSVKCRLGVDEHDTYGELKRFVQIVSDRGGVKHFVVHARKCFLRGLNPHQNRTVPPLRHEWVWALKRDFPDLEFSLNGGLSGAHEAAAAIALDAAGLGPKAIHGVMLGRSAYNDPWGALGDADVAVFGAPENAARSRRQVLNDYCTYADSMFGRWAIKEDGHRDPSVRALAKPLLNLFHGERGCKRWKQAMDAALRDEHDSLRALLDQTLQYIPDEVLDAPPRSLVAASASPAEAGAEATAGHGAAGAEVTSAGFAAEATCAGTAAGPGSSESVAAAGVQVEAAAAPAAGPAAAGMGSQVAQAEAKEERRQQQQPRPAPCIAYSIGELPLLGTERAGIHQEPWLAADHGSPRRQRNPPKARAGSDSGSIGGLGAGSTAVAAGVAVAAG